ncbi:MAG: hypothetical protein R6T99_07180 [Bacteroidales bacterium]
MKTLSRKLEDVKNAFTLLNNEELNHIRGGVNDNDDDPTKYVIEEDDDIWM